MKTQEFELISFTHKAKKVVIDFLDLLLDNFFLFLSYKSADVDVTLNGTNGHRSHSFYHMGWIVDTLLNAVTWHQNRTTSVSKVCLNVTTTSVLGFK